ncbi:MAG: hypothetical protein HN877_09775 [Rhodospirillaceae bacterium]|nr:hypothetical protein [Rhodospirillaceae bacterium]MBT7511405.1 hypothetical protein [Rhodospirillaceae bacterium]
MLTRFTDNINEVSAAVGQTQGSADQVLEAAQELSQQAELLHNQVDEFLVGIRKA